jgi:hypothetical protein
MRLNAQKQGSSHKHDDSMRDLPRAHKSQRAPERKRLRTMGFIQISSDNAEGIRDEEYGQINDPSIITGPVNDLVHPLMSKGWTIRPDHPMCFVFDSHSPARRFQPGPPNHPASTLPTGGSEAEQAITEIDDNAPGWIPLAPQGHRYV